VTITIDVREALRVEDLTVRVQGPAGYDIVSGLDLVLRRGEVFGLVGESGSGKTTLALALLGYARPGTEITGSVTIDGTDIIAADERSRRHARRTIVSYVPQDPSVSLNPALRLGVQLVETMTADDEPAGRSRMRRGHGLPARVAELLAKVRLPATEEFLRRYPHQLSGGQLQRISIAMAMLNRPKLIVFDEPTTGLDVSTQSHVLDTIREVIATEETAAVYVTHDLTVVGDIADRVGVMYSGLLVEQARTEDMLHHPAHPYSRRLVLATPSVRERRELVGIAGTPTSPKDRGTGCPFASRCELVEPACVSEPPAVITVGSEHITRCRRATSVDIRVGVRRTPGGGVWQVQPRPAERPADVLAVDSVNAWYGQSQVLHDISVKVRTGECVALVGESGSGKTTLARCVSGLHPDLVQGNLLFGDKEIGWPARERTIKVRREVQYIFQNPHASLNPRHTVARSIAAPLLTFKLVDGAAARRTRVRELLERVALPTDYENRYPSQLSGGERQRVAIARALAAEPRLLVCDEITSSLDVSIQASILQLLGELRRDSELTMLFITHHLGLVRAVADQIVILNGGKVVERGSAGAVLDSPRDPYTVELLANTPSPIVLDAAAAG
jgi:peptide/nickel transport system ATP-binding protein